MTEVMSLVELIIIYLACGAPFAVYRATSSHASTSTKWLDFATALVGWPIFAAMLLTRRVRSSTAAPEAGIEKLRVQMETAAFPDNAIQGVFDFRETFYRFVGLSNAVNEPESDKPATELFEIGGGGNSQTAARCLARRNRIRLHRHYLKARLEFMSSIAERADENLNSLASELAAHLGDPLTRRELQPPANVIADSTNNRIQPRNNTVHATVN